MEEGRYHYHHHHGHDTSSTNEGRGSQQELNSQSQTNEQQQQQQRYVNQPETLSPIYIRAPNPTIILRSDLHRLRAQLAARPPTVVRPAGGMNQLQQNTFQVPSFPPPPQQHIPPGNYHRKKNNYIF
ncbi:unnamed protein product [Adineta steineri]|uniref:Uncharacterized protein n=1 Tax=Adineta steineri TaxID=433720 RepID=A0A818W924_9BILA|nr:unnamed protein product [Adineta steineri]